MIRLEVRDGKQIWSQPELAEHRGPSCHAHGFLLAEVVHNNFVKTATQLGSKSGSLLALQFSHFLRRLLSHAKDGLPRHGSSRPFPGFNDIKATVPEGCNIARRELRPAHSGDGRDLCIGVIDRLRSARR